MDVFSWSMPFLAEKVVTMLHTIVKQGVGAGDDNDDLDLDQLAITNASGSRKSLMSIYLQLFQ